ncbi:hypothetical protein [Microcoleus vaginatus]|uniref:hypothetical protein n=1 Tax=Microcoleus vaginatus TaxID=119532 RepID=UPI0032A727FA
MTEWKNTFVFQGKELSYNRIKFNNPSERAVEVAIAFDFLANLDSKKRILEVGHVLSHYENTLSDYLGIKSRQIIDKFEKDVGVDNQDLISFLSPEKYDAIVSVSTVEHIGQGAEPSGHYGQSVESRDLEEPLKAIAKIYDLLATDGKALITVPFGKLTDAGWFIQCSQEYLDLLVEKYGIPQAAISISFLKLINIETTSSSPRMVWGESNAVALSSVEYNSPWPCANGIAVIQLSKVSADFHLNLNAEPTPLFYEMLYQEQQELEKSQPEIQTAGELEQSPDFIFLVSTLAAQLHTSEEELEESHAFVQLMQGKIEQLQGVQEQLSQTQEELKRIQTLMQEVQAEKDWLQSKYLAVRQMAHQLQKELEQALARQR